MDQNMDKNTDKNNSKRKPHKTQLRTEQTKLKLINAAKKLFIKNGFAATSITQIADLAKINRSLIFHHFGDKDNLWQLAKQSIEKNATEKLENKSIVPDFKSNSWPEFLFELINNLITFYRETPEIIALINWQRIENMQTSIGSKVNSAQKIISAIDKYKKSGDIKPEIKSEYILCLILGISTSAGMDRIKFIQSAEELKEYINFCVDIIIKAT